MLGEEWSPKAACSKSICELVRKCRNCCAVSSGAALPYGWQGPWCLLCSASSFTVPWSLQQGPSSWTLMCSGLWDCNILNPKSSLTGVFSEVLYHFCVHDILNCHTLKQWGTCANELFLPESSIQHSSNKVIKLCWDVILFYKTLLAHSGIIKNQPPNQWVSLEICLFA